MTNIYMKCNNNYEFKVYGSYMITINLWSLAYFSAIAANMLCHIIQFLSTNQLSSLNIKYFEIKKNYLQFPQIYEMQLVSMNHFIIHSETYYA